MWGSVKEIDAAELATWIESEGETVRVVDVREMREIERGIVPGAQPVTAIANPHRVVAGKRNPAPQLCRLLRQRRRQEAQIRG